MTHIQIIALIGLILTVAMLYWAGYPWRGFVDVVSGGFPCTDISQAGKKAGIEGEASSLWRHMARIISEVRPRFAFVENSSALTHRGLGTVLGDLAELGFSARWGVLGSNHVGAPTPEPVAGSWPTPCHGSSRWGGTFQEVGGSQNKLRGTPTGKLYVNPDFWESLMGWPIGWTGTAPLETAKIQEWQQLHFLSFQSEVAA
ncbi:DNA cytosine methyltransferase [Pseudomonas protegens]|uniref:DNA cytosine methyltransferase n=1 Tax=Pseudomonas protegens TaxID=380021 RepID=UPI00183DF953|nr:DNA cytosine methyltransferase [Pseudomonas protegens]